MEEIKKELYQKCLYYIEERIKTAKSAILIAQEALENDTKSSAGDKYETMREMMQQEISRNQLHLQEALRLQNALNQVHSNNNAETIQAGNIAVTTQGNFYIAISAGQIHLNSKTFFAISPASPIGKLLTGLKANEKVSFNGKEFKILQVF